MAGDVGAGHDNVDSRVAPDAQSRRRHRVLAPIDERHETASRRAQRARDRGLRRRGAAGVPSAGISTVLPALRSSEKRS